MDNVISIKPMTTEDKLAGVINVLKICGGFDISTADKISLIRETLRNLGENPTVTPMINKSP
jgi:hypothetical protein